MPTAEEVLDIERSFLGEGGQRFWNWYPSGQVAWCCIFQSYCLTAAGIPTHFAWVSALFDTYRAQDRTSTDPRSAVPGALIAFEWNQTPGGYDHIAMVESVDADRDGCYAINGNVNGSRVQRLFHPFNGGGIAEVAFPEYTTPTPPNPDEDEMKRYLIRGDKSPAVFLCDAGLGWKWHIPAGQMKNVSYVVSQVSGGQFLIPPGAKVDNVEGASVWVAEQAFVDAIPTVA